MGLDILHYIQSFSSPFLDGFANAVTMLGEQFVIILVLCFVYWVLDKEKGEYMILTLLVSLLLNNAAKKIFMRARPIGAPGVRSLRIETATGSSFPSGHTQNAASAYSALAFAFEKGWLYAAAAVIIVLVGLSRLYLGVHWPGDAAAGAALGIIISCTLKNLSRHNIFDKSSAFGIAAFFFIIVALVTKDPDTVKAAGLALGAAVCVRIEHRCVGFTTDRPWGKLILRYVLGVVLIAGGHLGMKALFPASLFFSFLRYAGVAALAMLGCPWIFVKLRL